MALDVTTATVPAAPRDDPTTVAVPAAGGAADSGDRRVRRASPVAAWVPDATGGLVLRWVTLV